MSSTVFLNNDGLNIADALAQHWLTVRPASELSADRHLLLDTGDADRTVVLQGNPTLDDWFDQSVKVDAEPEFAGLRIKGDGSSSFKLSRRAGVTAFPVPFLQPIEDDEPLAFDLMPKGNPVEVAGHGKAWIDLCDADLEANPNAPTVAARVGVRSDCVMIGEMTFNGATPVPVVFVVGASPNPVQGFRMETTGRLTTKASSSTDAGLVITPGTLPSSPVNGALIATSAGLYYRHNGVTKQVSLV